MEDMYSRTEMLIGDGAATLRSSSVAVFGCGGVGSYVVEALARAGVGALTVVDADKVSASNVNRQLIALTETIGRPKVEVEKERILSINPDCRVTAYETFYNEETCGAIDLSGYDYVCDAIDTVTSKILLAKKCRDAGVRLISSMGTGNKLDPSRFEIADISKTSVCPLARVMRRELRAVGILHLKVVYSKEEPAKTSFAEADGHGRHIPASISFVPGAAGLMIAGEIIREIAGIAL